MDMNKEESNPLDVLTNPDREAEKRELYERALEETQAEQESMNDRENCGCDVHDYCSVHQAEIDARNNTPDTEWSEALQVEVMDGYLHLAEMRQFAKDPVAHMEEMREHWQKLQDFISTLLSSRDTYWKEQLQKAREEERGRIEAVFKEHVPPHAMDLEDSVWLKRLLNKAFNHDKNI